MAQHTIKFVIKQDGTVTEEVIGVVGNECENLTKNIEEKLPPPPIIFLQNSNYL